MHGAEQPGATMGQGGGTHVKDQGQDGAKRWP